MTLTHTPRPHTNLDALQHLSPAQRMDALLSLDDAADAIQTLHPLSLYHLLRDIGPADAIDLTALASPDQLQAFLDLDAWHRDDFHPPAWLEWISPLLDNLPLDEFCEKLVDLDPEPLILTLQEHLIAFHFDEHQEVPPEIEALEQPWETLDGVYGFLLPLDQDDLANQLRNLLKRLYHADLQLAHRVLEACRWELRSHLQEAAWQLRSARMAELGFLPFDEAALIYAWRSPHEHRDALLQQLQHNPHTTPHHEPRWRFDLPDLFREQLHHDHSFLQRALSHLLAQGHDLQPLQHTLLNLHNRAMIADAIEPRDLEAARLLFSRVRGLLSLSLEFIADRDLDTAAALLAQRNLIDLFRVGHNLTAALARQARRLTRDAPTLSITQDHPLGLLSDDDRALLDALLLPRPLYARAGQPWPNPFSSFADLEEAATRLSLLAARVTLAFGLLQLSTDQVTRAAYAPNTLPPVELIDLHTLLATALANLTRQPAPDDLLSPLSPQHLLDLLAGPIALTQQHLQHAQHDPIARREALHRSPLFLRALEHFSPRLPSDHTARKTLAAALRHEVARLTDLLGHLHTSDLIDLHSLGPALLVSHHHD
jgi:hypothetical protein